MDLNSISKINEKSFAFFACFFVFFAVKLLFPPAHPDFPKGSKHTQFIPSCACVSLLCFFEVKKNSGQYAAPPELCFYF